MRLVKWNDISKYRSELFGLSIISIIIFHYTEHAYCRESVHLVLRVLFKIYNGVVGSIGVDIFMFLSGFGIYYSLMKNPPLDSFYRKRFFRVLVPYLVLGGTFWVIREFVLFHHDMMRFLYDYSLLSFWIEGAN